MLVKSLWRHRINISSVDYINNLTFDYIEKYSFQRRIVYKKYLKAIRPGYNELK
jgi:hypothetical protein